MVEAGDIKGKRQKALDRIAELEAALYAIMRVTDPGDVRTQVGRERWEASAPARRIARETLGLPLMGNPLDDAPGPPRVVAGDQLDAERRGECTSCLHPAHPTSACRVFSSLDRCGCTDYTEG